MWLGNVFGKLLHTRVSNVVFFIQILTIFFLQIIIIFIKLLCILMGTNCTLLTPDGCVDRGCEKEGTLINDVCRWHCTMRWWRDRHNRVLGDLEEGIRGQRDEDQPYQQTKNPIHGLNFGHDNGQGREPVRGRATKSSILSISVQAWRRQEAWQQKLHR